MCELLRCFTVAFDGKIKGRLSQQHPQVLLPVVAFDRREQWQLSTVVLVDVTTRVDQQLQDSGGTLLGTNWHHVVPIGISAVGQ